MLRERSRPPARRRRLWCRRRLLAQLGARLGRPVEHLGTLAVLVDQMTDAQDSRSPRSSRGTRSQHHQVLVHESPIRNIGLPGRLLACALACASCTEAPKRSAEAASQPAAPAASTPSVASAPATPVRLHQERTYTLGPDSVPLKFVLDAVGQRDDSLDVDFRVLRADSVIYRQKWNSNSYMTCYGCDPDFAKEMLPRIRPALEALLDKGLLPAAPDTGRSWEQESHYSSFASHVIAALLPTGATREDTVAAMATLVTEPNTGLAAKADSIVREQRTRAAFRYDVGEESYCIIGWSPLLRRMIELVCGP
jgi:hypothetical protein